MNRAYENIIKWGTIKHAIIGHIKNPPMGFEEVILKNFWLKKQILLEQAKNWVEEAATLQKADYTGLVSSHNSQHCLKFVASPTAYKEEMEKVY